MFDPSACQGHGRCSLLCPELFVFRDGADKPEIMKSSVPESLRDAARRAVKACPERALSIQDNET